jgi:predicted phage terminase large subunit-like protein
MREDTRLPLPALEPRIPRGYVPHVPTARQAAFLAPIVNQVREVFFGGAAGGGKSDALLMAALQYVDVPGYAAILFRKTYADLALEGALMDRAREWLAPTDARWSDRDHRWTFPSGATLSFGYIEHAGDEERYASAEFQLIGFDELTQFSERQYRFMFSRLRRTVNVDVPLRMRGASNPLGPGKAWVHQRFVLPGARPGRLFISSRLEDNPYLDQAEYEANLALLGAVEFRQLRWGDWDVKPEGRMFKRAWFAEAARDEADGSAERVRYWDLAASETPKAPSARKAGDPDWTAGLRLARSAAGIYVVEDVVRDRLSPAGVEQMIRATADADGRAVPIRMEQEGGASGKSLVSHYRRHVLDGFDFRGVTSSGSKEVRAKPVAARAEAGEILLARGPWVDAFLDELAEFPEGLHDDQVDALSGAYGYLAAAASRSHPVKPQGFTAGSHWRNA